MSEFSKEIVIKKEDIEPFIYFVCSIAQRGKMYGGLNGKSDNIGGILDRFINIIPESIIFNNYFLPKISDKLTVIPDYYEYDPKKAGIAPDVLGIKSETKFFPFVEFDNIWRSKDKAPQIEIKTFKKKQFMVSLRNQNYNNKYLVMIEMNLKSDYLLPFFEQSVLSDKVYEKMKMDNSIFIKKNEFNTVTYLTKVDLKPNPIGTLKLITVCLADDFMNYANHFKAKESPFYIEEIKETRNSKSIESKPLLNYLSLNTSGLYSWRNNILDKEKNHKLLDVYIQNPENLNFIKSSKSSITFKTKGNSKLNDIELKDNQTYIIKFKLLDRSSNNGEEYFINKSIIDKIPNSEVKMLTEIKDFIS